MKTKRKPKKKAKPVKAWGLVRKGKLWNEAFGDRNDLADFREENDRVVRVELREV